jgi:hypothetical protein
MVPLATPDGVREARLDQRVVAAGWRRVPRAWPANWGCRSWSRTVTVMVEIPRRRRARRSPATPDGRRQDTADGARVTDELDRRLLRDHDLAGARVDRRA